MSAETFVNDTPSRTQAPKSKTWIYVLIVILLILGGGYYSIQNQSSASINHDFYRVLYEASNKFNENLNSLHSMHQSEESEVSVRSLLPSYYRISSSLKDLDKNKYVYTLKGQKIEISNHDLKASIDLEDLLPKTAEGFSQYLFADSNGKVLANTGGEKTISIVEMKSINQQLLKDSQSSLMNFNTKPESNELEQEPPLPTFSSHVDMQLSYGDFRIFIFPFTLSTSLTDSVSGKVTIDRLYLVGLLPKYELNNKGSGHWNISVLVVTLISLLFMWALIRLFLLPENHSITKFYRTLSQSSSYLFYLVLVALILSYLTKSGLQSYKDQQAYKYANDLAAELKMDLKEVFNELSSYQGFYSTAIKELKKLQPVPSPTTSSDNSKTQNVDATASKDDNAVPCLDTITNDENRTVVSVEAEANKIETWSYQKTVSALTLALNALAEDRQSCVNCTIDKPLPNIMASDKWHIKLKVNYALDWSSIIDTMFGIKTNDKNGDTKNNTQLELGSNVPTDDIYTKTRTELGALSFYSGELRVEFNHQNNVYNSYIPHKIFDPTNTQSDPVAQQPYIPPKILTVFATDEKGYGNLPSIYYQESNSKPQAFELSHRKYFKKVRDYQGWLLDFNEYKESPLEHSADKRHTTIKDSKQMNDVVFRNVYIQRLLNINDGTRGTTISVPMHQPNLNMLKDMSVAGYMLGADVILPSVSLAPPSEFDFEFMVVDRNTGNVLFHSDEDRSLVENLFYAGHSESHLSQWIKAGLDKQRQLGGNQINGFYHGEAGRYTLAPTIVDNWAMVVFSPNDSLDSFMTNQFMYILVTFILLLAVILLFAKIADHWTSGRWLRLNLGLPHQLDTKRVMLICTALFTTNYGLFYIGQLLQISFPDKTHLHWIFSPALPLLGVAFLLVMVFRFYVRHFTPNNDHAAELKRFNKGAKLFSFCLWIVALLHFVYLQFTAAMPLKTLQFHYTQQECNGENKEYQELTQMALKRYPNSVTKERISPFSLLPMEETWQKKMLNKSAKNQDDAKSEGNEEGQCNGYLSSVVPDDYPKMSTLVGSTYLWKWMKTYLIDVDHNQSDINSNVAQSAPEWDLILFSIFVLMSLVWVWFYFNRKVLWPRIYCPSTFLNHIEELCHSVSNMNHERPSAKLNIKIDSHKLSGIGIALLLRSQKVKGYNNKTDILPGFTHLFQLSPCLQLFSSNDTFLPNLKMDVNIDQETGLLNVKIWDIETCLEKVEFRQHLLDLIMEIKSLTMSNNLNSFTIYSGFMSLRRVKMKDPLSKMANSALEHAEYMSWSECLMDFSVFVTSEFVHNIDYDFLEKEMEYVPELRFLAEQIPSWGERKSTDNKGSNFWEKSDSTIDSAQWATIHYILLHADALYRFKWESCSSAEKLALYNLAKQHRLNPRNTEMIEHLAINGMIKVRSDHLTIVNKSFAHFVLHAETKETLSQLIQQGEAGVWNNYRLPLGMLIVLIIGGVAITSGQSIFIIVASLAGVLGTIGSLTNSASLLKDKFKD